MSEINSSDEVGVVLSFCLKFFLLIIIEIIGYRTSNASVHKALTWVNESARLKMTRLMKVNIELLHTNSDKLLQDIQSLQQMGMQ